MDAGKNPETDVVSFGPFRLLPSERRVERDGVPIAIGSRALDLLIALTAQAGEVVGKQELFARVWPDLVVEESSLRGHIAGLRRALQDGQDGVRYIANVPGRGYSFVAPTTRTALPESPLPADFSFTSNLPARPEHMVGREETVSVVAQQVSEHRLVTVIGPGGIGKTTVAIAVGHELQAAFNNSVVFVDLATMAQPALLVATVAATLGLPSQNADMLSGLLAFLRDRRLLLIVDNCEHLVGATAAMVERIVDATHHVHVLATSREPLRAKDEQAYTLPPLRAPTESANLTAAEALTYPAVQLFMDRAAASGNAFTLCDEDAPLVGDICCRLDGIALAIELAAGRIGAFGLRGMAKLLDGRLQLLWRGRRTALPRHQTLTALLDWSYDLLSADEQLVLRRLSIPVSALPLQSVCALLADDKLAEARVIESVASLVAKSLLSAENRDGFAWYRLLETTRAYASEKLAESGESDEIARRHAGWVVLQLKGRRQHPPASTQTPRPDTAAMLANARTALEWSLSDRGDPRLTVDLTVAAAPLFLDMSLLSECARWSEAALSRLDGSAIGAAVELDLQEDLAISTMFGEGNGERVQAAIRRGLELARDLGDGKRQLMLLAGQNIFLTRAGDFRGGLEVAEESGRVARELGDPSQLIVTDWMLGVAHHLVGHQAAAQGYLSQGLGHGDSLPEESTNVFGFDQRIRALVVRARVLWLRGFADRAATVAREAIDLAAKLRHPVGVCISLIYTVPVFVWRGDQRMAEDLADRLIDYAQTYSLHPYHAAGLGLKGKALARRGQALAARDILRSSLETLDAEGYHLLTTGLMGAFADSLAATGDPEAALNAIDKGLVRARENGPTYDLPELLRIRGQILGRLCAPKEGEIEIQLMQALDTARAQSALGFELRAAHCLAEFWAGNGRADEAFELLAGVYARFSEGFETQDLRSARRLLDTLSSPERNFSLGDIPGRSPPF